MSDIGKLVGERIRNIRKQKGLSQEELGQLADLHPKYVSSIERAEKNISLEAVGKVAFAFGMTLEELFSNLQPKAGTDDDNLIKIYNLLQSRSAEDHNAMLKNLQGLFEWKDK